LELATKDEAAEITKILSGRAILNMQKLVRRLPVGDHVREYVVRLVRATRPRDSEAPAFIKKMVDWGAGPRAGIFLIQGAKAMAAMDGRFSVAIDDVKKVAIPVLRHRKKMVDWGAGPRAGIFLIQGAKAMAAMDGRFSVAIDDVKKVAIPVLRHR